MDLKSGHPFWAVKNGLPHLFPPLQDDLRCDVAIIGCGITGALIADELARSGHSVAMVDSRDVGWGSTSASTALLQYEIDTHLVDLAKQHGETHAVMAYRACADAIDVVAELAGCVGSVDFARMESLYYASKRGHRDDLQEEYALRLQHGFDVEWLDADALEERAGFSAPAAILSRKAARVDPYRLTYGLLQQLERDGVAVHDRSVLEHVAADSRGVQLVAKSGGSIRAKWLVIAAGYGSQRFLKQRVAANRSSYAFVTEPVDDDALGILRDTMVWESARPYLYMRRTGEGRLVIGGEDDSVDIPARRDAAIGTKTAKLCKQVSKLFPHIDLQPAFAWAGTFAETEDGLPWFGPHAETGPRVLYAMAYGGNGITFSAIGAGLIRAHVERRAHPLKTFFGFDRKA